MEHVEAGSGGGHDVAGWLRGTVGIDEGCFVKARCDCVGEQLVEVWGDAAAVVAFVLDVADEEAPGAPPDGK